MSETFKKGDIVECVDPGHCEAIHAGGRYLVVADADRRLGSVRVRFGKADSAVGAYMARRFRLASRAAIPADATDAKPTCFGLFRSPQHDAEADCHSCPAEPACAATSAKPTNPKDAIGSGKLPLHLWPPIASAFGAIGLLHGMLKYGRTNWRAAGVRSSIYRDAMHRHIDDWFEGNDLDEDGCDNLGAVLACAAILLDAREAGKLVDDRQFAGGFYRKAKDRLTGQVARLKALHAGKDPKHWTIADNGETP